MRVEQNDTPVRVLHKDEEVEVGAFVQNGADGWTTCVQAKFRRL